MKTEEINQIDPFLLSNNNTEIHLLFFLCICEISERCLKELNMLIKSDNLLDDYYIKFVNRDSYLLW